ncbi:MAG: amidohydrolase [Deltaproteobacteria bacterium]|nr:amidohydrolase [Deltaproteobacteria bacterium]
MLNTPLPALNDLEGLRVPNAMPFVVDAHIHIFPPEIFKAVWYWFDEHGWPIRYRLDTPEILNFLLSRGIGHVVALQYAHKPGIAEDLNRYMAKICEQHAGRVTGMATVFPGEPESEIILKKAFDSGLKGLKMHAHVQCFDMDGPEMDLIYQVCASRGKPIVIHAGREPKSPAYLCDPYELCAVEKVERVIKNFSKLKICVPHLGIDEYTDYQRLIERYDNLWLDTAMAITDYFPNYSPPSLHEMRWDRIMFGTDFPNIPYAWDREIKCIEKENLPEAALERIMGKNAIDFFSIEIPS